MDGKLFCFSKEISSRSRKIPQEVDIVKPSAELGYAAVINLTLGNFPGWVLRPLSVASSMENLEAIFLHRSGPRLPPRFKFNPCPRLCLANSHPSFWSLFEVARYHVKIHREVKTIWTFVDTRKVPDGNSLVIGKNDFTILSLSLSFCQ